MFPEDLPPGAPPKRDLPEVISLLDKNCKPAYRKGRRPSPAEKAEIEKQLEEQLKGGRVRISHSPWGAAVLFAKKKDGSLRLCVDYRALNALTRKNRYPLPRMDELLDMVQGATVFSKLDLKSGYNQIALSEEEMAYTAFLTHMGQFEYTVVPFGLCNAPSVFQQAMNKTLHGLVGKFCVVYLDDVLIFSKTKADHINTFFSGGCEGF